MAKEKKFDVTGFGDATLDYLCSIASIANFNQSTFISDIKVLGGGCIPTSLVTLQRLGGRTAFICSLGDDIRGKEIVEELKKEKVNCEAIKYIKDVPSPISFVQVDKKQGDRAIAYYPGSCKLLKFDEAAKEKVSLSRILQIDGFNSKEDLKAVKFAHSQGVKVMLDANAVFEDTGTLLPFIDYLITSKAFLHEFTGIENIESALRQIHDLANPEILVTTLGSKGSVALLNDGVLFVEGFKVKAMDTTGAGDVYHGAFLFGILKEWDLKDIMVFSSAAAAIKCASCGGRKGIPNYKSIIKFLKKEKSILKSL